MEFRNLNTFLKVASLQNFTQAAQQLGYSQSNVSAQIKQLEAEMGRPLFDRIGRNVYLTSYGRELVPYARQIVSTVMEMENLSKPEADLTGVLRFGLTDSISELLLDETLLRFHRRLPGVRLELVVDAPVVLQSAMQRGLLDAACVISDPLSPGEWNIPHTLEVPVVPVANPANPCLHNGCIAPEDLEKQDVILMEASASYSVDFEQYLSRVAPGLTPFLRMPDSDAAARLVEKEASFISILPLYTVQSRIDEGRLCVLQLPGWDHRQSIQLVLHRSKAVTPQLRGFMEELWAVLSETLALRLPSFSESV